MADDNVSPMSFSPSSYVRDDLPEGGLAELELEDVRKRLKDERKDGFRVYAEGKLGKDGEGFA